jgi:hypothetical protein
MTTNHAHIPENYCALPFRHLALQPDNEIRLCCSWTNLHNRVPVSLLDDDPFYSEWMQNLRQQMLENQVIPGCVRCKTQEDQLKLSMRIGAN